MSEKTEELKIDELTTRQNGNMIDGVMNNAPLAPPTSVPENKPLDRVKPPSRNSRSHELER